jgi:pectin methylesterase-like acyl-CoA thioesterase
MPENKEELFGFGSAGFTQSEEEKEYQKKLKKKLRKKVKKYDTVGALWIADDGDQVHITQNEIFRYLNTLFKEKDRHIGNKYYFQLELMMKLSYQNDDIKELKEKIKELEKRLPIS